MKKVISTLLLSIGLCTSFGINAPIPYFTYRHLSGNTWIVYLHLYNNCDYYTTSSLAAAYGAHDTCNFKTKSINVTLRKDTLPFGGGMQHSNVYGRNCTGTLTMCDAPFNGTGLAAWRNVIYTDTITLPEGCGMWKFSLGALSQANYRDPMLTNIAPSTWTYYGEAILNADSLNPNTSAVYQRPFVLYAYAGQPTQWYIPTVDTDGDSLVYSLVAPRERDAKYPNPLDTLIQNINYIAPYSLAEPFNTGGTWQFDAATPCMRFTAGAAGQLALITIRIDEYRNGVFMGATFRDHIIITLNSSTIVPKRSVDLNSTQNVTFGGTDDTVVVYTNQSMQVCYKHYSTQTTAKLRMEHTATSVLPTGANYSVNQPSGDSIITCLQWTPAVADTGTYFIHTMLEDTACSSAEPIVPQDYFQVVRVKYKPSSLNEYQRNDMISVYPNPSHAGKEVYVQVANMHLHGTITIYDMQGKLLLQRALNQPHTPIRLASLPRGLYFYQYTTPDKYMQIGKLMVK